MVERRQSLMSRCQALVMLAIGSCFLLSGAAWSQEKGAAVKAPVTPKPVAGAEIVEADVSSRSIAVTSDFTGQEVIIFGSIHNSRQETPKSNYYDVVVVVESSFSSMVLRRKGNVAGVWMNTESTTFDRVPNFYATLSTRPLNKIADAALFDDQGIGFSHIRITPRHPLDKEAFEQQKEAIIRLKKKEKVYIQDENGVKFIGRSLFRSSVMLPSNIPVGLLNTRVFLFHDGKLLSTYQAKLHLEREGLERWLHDLAYTNSFLYGLLAIFTAIAAGLLASELSRRRLM